MNDTIEKSESDTKQSAPAGRFLTFRRVALVTVAVAGLAVGGYALVNEARLAPLRVTPHPVSTEPGALKVAANEEVPAGAALEADETVLEDTPAFASSFPQSLSSAREQWNDKKPQNIAVTADQCLSTWAVEHLPEYAGTSKYDVIDICGRPTAIVVGAAGVDDRVLVYNAIQKDAPANVERVRDVLIKSKDARWAFASVRSSDSSTVMMVAAAVAGGDAEPAPEFIPEPGSTEGPPILNVRPPGVEIVPDNKPVARR